MSTPKHRWPIFQVSKMLREIEDELVVKKMKKISEKINKGELKTESWKEVKRKYAFR